MVAAGQVYERPGLRVVDDPRVGRFVVTDQPIPAREVVVIWSGEEMTLAQVQDLTPRERDYILQVDDDRYLVTSLDGLCTADFINHSCEPNCGLLDSITLVSMRPIEPGEQITFDYSTSDTSPVVDFECRCGAPSCRGRMTGDDWRSPEVQRRYAGWFAPHVQRRIDRS